MKDKKIVLFPGFRHVVPADFESWLEKMASAGWHIDRITQWSSFVMVFRRGAPKKYRFVYDLQAAPRKDYRAIYQEFGWEYLGRMASVFIWRKEYREARLEAFSDQESILQRNRRTLIAVFHCFLYVFAGRPNPRSLLFYSNACPRRVVPSRACLGPVPGCCRLPGQSDAENWKKTRVLNFQ